MSTGQATEPIQLTIRRARLEDLQRIVVLEHECFRTPWPTWLLRREMLASSNVFLVAEVQGVVEGYVGMSVAVEEAHVTTLAVAPEQRGRGIGELLLLTVLQRGQERGVARAVLQYRVTNLSAARLYQKVGFTPRRVRKRYYDDNDEDAVEAVLEELDSVAQQERLADMVRRWEARHGGSFAVVREPDLGY